MKKTSSRRDAGPWVDTHIIPSSTYRNNTTVTPLLRSRPRPNERETENPDVYYVYLLTNIDESGKELTEVQLGTDFDQIRMKLGLFHQGVGSCGLSFSTRADDTDSEDDSSAANSIALWPSNPRALQDSGQQSMYSVTPLEQGTTSSTHGNASRSATPSKSRGSSKKSRSSRPKKKPKTVKIVSMTLVCSRFSEVQVAEIREEWKVGARTLRNRMKHGLELAAKHKVPVLVDEVHLLGHLKIECVAQLYEQQRFIRDALNIPS